MSLAVWVVFLVCMLANAVIFSALGQGGGVLYTPIQVLFGIDFHTAATTTLFLIIVTSISSTLVFRKARTVDWPMALALESSTTVGAFLGGAVSGQLSGRFLSFLFAAVIALAAVFMVRDFQPRRATRVGRHWLFAWKRNLGTESYTVNLALALPISFVAGAVSGMIGVSGGILKVPMMVLLFGVPMNIAIGSSAFMVGITAAGGFAGHVVSGHWDWRTAVVVAALVFAGGQLGARIALSIDKTKMKRGFGWFLVLMAVLMVWQALR